MKTLNLKDKSNEVNSSFNGDKVEVNKYMSRIMREAKHRAMPNTCLLCGKEVSSLCNSHTVPAFSLRNIGNNGEVSTPNTIIDFPFYLKRKVGIKESGTFHLICNQCDSITFQEYENPNAYEREPTPKILAEIALKNNLKAISKRLVEMNMYDIIGENQPLHNEYVQSINAVKDLDLVEYFIALDKAKKLAEKTYNDGYYVISYMLLNYVTPIAYQGLVTLYVDFDGNIVNDIYDMRQSYHTKELNVCVFPLETKTAVLLFIDNNETRYKSFYKKFRRLSEDDKLAVINYIILLYTEDYFITKDLGQKMASNNKVAEIIGQTSTGLISFEELLTNDKTDAMKEIYRLDKYKCIPNYLSEAFKLR